MTSYNTQLRHLRAERSLQPRPYRFWGADEIAAIWAKRSAGMAWPDIARDLGQDVNAVRSAAWNWRVAGKVEI